MQPFTYSASMQLVSRFMPRLLRNFLYDADPLPPSSHREAAVHWALRKLADSTLTFVSKDLFVVATFSRCVCLLSCMESLILL